MLSLWKNGFDRRREENFPAEHYFLRKPVKSVAFSQFFFCENSAISRLSRYCAAKMFEMRARAVFKCDSFVFLHF